jgi:putative ATP-binding cassette transporter
MIMTIGEASQVSEDKNQAEAEYRYALTRVRGERRKHHAARRRGRRARRHRQDLYKSSAAMGTARRPAHAHHAGVAGIGLIAPVVPLLLCAPKFLDGSMSWTGDAGGFRLHSIVQTAFGWLVDNYPRLADWNACARRIASLMMSPRRPRARRAGRRHRPHQARETEGDAMLSPQ